MTFETKPARPFVRSTSDRWVAGVCAGLADNFGLDTSLVRAAVVVASLFSFGTVALLYIAAWILMPEA
jgi:phage shock protein C